MSHICKNAIDTGSTPNGRVILLATIVENDLEADENDLLDERKMILSNASSAKPTLIYSIDSRKTLDHGIAFAMNEWQVNVPGEFVAVMPFHQTGVHYDVTKPAVATSSKDVNYNGVLFFEEIVPNTYVVGEVRDAVRNNLYPFYPQETLDMVFQSLQQGTLDGGSMAPIRRVHGILDKKYDPDCMDSGEPLTFNVLCLLPRDIVRVKLLPKGRAAMTMMMQIIDIEPLHTEFGPVTLASGQSVLADCYKTNGVKPQLPALLVHEHITNSTSDYHRYDIEVKAGGGTKKREEPVALTYDELRDLVQKEAVEVLRQRNPHLLTWQIMRLYRQLQQQRMSKPTSSAAFSSSSSSAAASTSDVSAPMTSSSFSSSSANAEKDKKKTDARDNFVDLT